MQYGLAQGKVFGVIGGTDNHCAHPGSYGQGLAGIWSESLSRVKLWEAIIERRTYALTGDRIKLKFSLNGSPMGSLLEPDKKRSMKIHVLAGGKIDYVDLVKNCQILKRFLQPRYQTPSPTGTTSTKLYLEVGWGHKGVRVDWQVEFGISDGVIRCVEPRFRGLEEIPKKDGSTNVNRSYYYSRWERVDERTVYFETTTWGNQNQTTNSNQGICLEVDLSLSATVNLVINDKKVDVPLRRLIEGAKSGSISNEIESASWMLHQAPLTEELRWDLSYDEQTDYENRDVYYIRVRQTNDQWAWSSPIYI
jgi:hypothetical protein